MKMLREQLVIRRPVEETETRVLAFFDSRRTSDGTLRMQLRVPAGADAPYRFTIARLVRVEARMRLDDDGHNDVIVVSWCPEGAAMLPRFEGKLRVWGGDDTAMSILELDGRYVPPSGIGGQPFDEAIGHEIARATALEFLYDIKSAIEEPAVSALDVGCDV